MCNLTRLLYLLLFTTLSTQAEEPPIKIGVIGPFTGKSSTDMGESIRGGARVFLHEINQVGGIMGRRIELVERDDEAKPEIGIAMAKDLIEKEKVIAAVGFGNTGVAIPASRIFQEAKIPLIISVATGVDVMRQFMTPAQPVSYVFRVSASDELQQLAILGDIIDKRKFTKIAILHDNSPYGEFGKQGLVAELGRRKMSAVAIESFKIGQQDMSEQLMKASQANAQIVVLYCLSNEAAMVANNIKKLKLNLPLAGSWTLSQQKFIELSGNNGEGSRMPLTFIENNANSRSGSFTQNYYKINNVARIPSAVSAAQTYDALRLLTLALMQANSTDGNKLQDALENMKYEATSTVITRYKKPFSKTDHEAISMNMLIIGEVHEGQISYAYKKDANSSLIARTKVILKKEHAIKKPD